MIASFAGGRPTGRSQALSPIWGVGKCIKWVGRLIIGLNKLVLSTPATEHLPQKNRANVSALELLSLGPS